MGILNISRLNLKTLNGIPKDSIKFLMRMGRGQPVHEYVDLGLPSGTLWATCNIGASSPGKQGKFFAWGETSTKSVYSESTYKYYDTETSTYTKYNATDNKIILDPEDDAANILWGLGWKMPTSLQLTELIKGCDWVAENNCMVGTSKYNNAKITFPAVGGFYNGKNKVNTGYSVFMACNKVENVSANLIYAFFIQFSTSKIQVFYPNKYLGHNIRPVRNVPTEALLDSNGNAILDDSGNYLLLDV